MTAASGQWTLGVLIGGPFWVLCIAAVLIIGGLLTFWSLRDHDGDGLLIAGGTMLALFIVVGAGVFFFWPFSSEYHQYRTVTGTVDKVSSRLVSAGDQGGSNQKFVVLLHGNGSPYGITDTRAALLKPGDTVHLRCKRVYEYGSNNAGYDCKWGQ